MTFSDTGVRSLPMVIFDPDLTLNPVCSRGSAIKNFTCRRCISIAWALALVALALSPVPSHAESAQSQLTPLQRVYGELQFAYGGVSHSDREFNPTFGSLSVGAWIRPGIGLEVFLDSGLSGGREGDFELEVTSTSGVAARFQAPSRNGFFAYILLGYIETSIDQKEQGDRGQRTVVQNYEGGRVSVGFGQEFNSVNGLVLVGEYRYYMVDQDLEIDAISIGFRLDIQ